MNGTSSLITRRPASRRLPLAAGLLAVGVLTACSGHDAVPSAAGPSAAGTTAADTPPGAPTSPSAAAETSEADGGATTVAAAGTPTTAPSPAPASVPVTDGPRPSTTDVELTFLGWNARTSAVEAGGYVSPVVEAGGRCTLQLKQGSRIVTVTSAAEPDASTTVCGGLSVSRAKLAAGSWTGTLSYASTKTSGTSNPAAVTVPR